jgi:hypothetical protein
MSGMAKEEEWRLHVWFSGRVLSKSNYDKRQGLNLVMADVSKHWDERFRIEVFWRLCFFSVSSIYEMNSGFNNSI